MSYFTERYKHDEEFRERIKANSSDYYHKRRVFPTKKVHGMRNTGVWRSWGYMKSRVLSKTNKDHRYYKNISMEPRWKEFTEFYKDMGDRPEGLTLDRIDNDKGYYPENCRWATRGQQARNKRNNAVDESMVLAVRQKIKEGVVGLKIAKELGISSNVVYNIKSGRSWQEVAHV